MASAWLIWITSLTAIAGVLLRPRDIAEAWWACGGAAILIVFSLISLPQAGAAVLQGVDVYLFLTGMMILSELAREEGVFDWIAEIAAVHARNSTGRLFSLVYLAGIVVTIFLSNDATAVVLTPAVLTIVKRLRVDPVPHLLGCAFIANAASFVLPISNPANLVIFDQHLPRLWQWMGTFALPSVAAIALTYLGLRALLKGRLGGRIEETLAKKRLSFEGRLALGGLAIAAVVLLASSASGWPLGAPTCAAAVLATALVAARDRHVPLTVIKGVSWSVIPLVAGLFVIVEALQGAGMLRLANGGLLFLQKQSFLAGKLVAAFAVGLLSNVMNNLPVGLISGHVIHAAGAKPWTINATLLGVDLGPNLSVTGSLATILWLMALRREGVKISGRQFFKIGLVVMPASLLACVLALQR
ncbi:MAG: arsenic transporter [Limisphaerales bacterium]